MVARSGIDHRIGGARFVLQHACIIKRANDRFDAVGRNRIGLDLAAHQAAHAMAGGNERRGNRTANKAIRTR